MFEPLTVEDVNARISSTIGEARGLFRPLAFFDKHTDSIRIELRDCSIKEYRIDELLTVHFDNNFEHGQSDIVGLTIKGVRHFFTQHNLPLDGIIRIAQLLDKVAQFAPQLVRDVANRKLAEGAIREVCSFARNTELSVDLRAKTDFSLVALPA